MSEGAGICGALLGEVVGTGAADSTAVYVPEVLSSVI